LVPAFPMAAVVSGERVRWSPEENRLILEHAARTQGTHDWESIAIKLTESAAARGTSRTADAVRNHFHRLIKSREGQEGYYFEETDHAPSRIRTERQKWTDEEDAIIMKGVNDLGKQWRVIAKRLPKRVDNGKHRSDNSVRNRWERLMKKSPVVADSPTSDDQPSPTTVAVEIPPATVSSILLPPPVQSPRPASSRLSVSSRLSETSILSPGLRPPAPATSMLPPFLQNSIQSFSAAQRSRSSFSLVPGFMAARCSGSTRRSDGTMRHDDERGESFRSWRQPSYASDDEELGRDAQMSGLHAEELSIGCVTGRMVRQPSVSEADEAFAAHVLTDPYETASPSEADDEATQAKIDEQAFTDINLDELLRQAEEVIATQ